MAFPTLILHLLLRNVTYKKEPVFVLDDWHCRSLPMWDLNHVMFYLFAG